jgi:CMP-N-acetylneuraminic acid synthetase
MKKKKLKCLIVIPARKNSKSIKQKNIKLFHSKPLIFWSIKIAKQSKLGKVVVSTDCLKIQKISKSLGVEAPFIRPKKLSLDKSTSESVVKHAINFYYKKNIHFDFIILLQPTSPFRIKNDLIKAKNIFKKNKKCTAVFTVTEVSANHNPQWLVKVNNKGLAKKFIDNSEMKYMLPRRQLLPKAYYRNDFVYLSDVKNFFLKNPNFYGSNPIALICDENRLDVDINTPKEWKYAESIFAKFIKKANNF